MTRKYVILPINAKQIDNNLYLRSVLIQYSEKENNTYKGTRHIGHSPYFDDSLKALQYKFDDNGYTLISDGYDNSPDLVMVKREYHTRFPWPYLEFSANSDEEALEKFKLSKYYDCDSKPIVVDPNMEQERKPEYGE